MTSRTTKMFRLCAASAMMAAACSEAGDASKVGRTASAASLSEASEPPPSPPPPPANPLRVRVAPVDADLAALLVEPGPDFEPDWLEWPLGSGVVEVNDLGIDADMVGGDGVYTGIGPFDVQQFEVARQEWQARIASLEDPRGMVFDGRNATEVFEAHPDLLDSSESIVELPTFGAVAAVTIFPAVTVTGVGGSKQGASLPPTSRAGKSLVITHPAVVNHPDYAGHWQKSVNGCNRIGDPNAPWSFRGLLEGIANGYVTPDELGSDWIRQNSTARPVNGYTIPAAYNGVWDLVNGSGVHSPSVPWPKLVDDGDASTFNDVLDFEQAPLELIAIVNRIDLAAGGYEEVSTPELRFVFTFINEETCEPANGNVILEYEVPGDCDEIWSWAKAWHDLSELDIESPEYADTLLQLTKPIIDPGANPARPNESNLKVLRTNEQVFRWPHYPTVYPTNAGFTWDMQEWVIDGSSHLFTNGLLAQTPGNDWEIPDWLSPAPHLQEVDSWIQANASNILSLQHQVPQTFASASFRAPFAVYGHVSATHPLPFSSNDFPPSTWSMWRAMSWGSANLTSDVEARQLFSLSTCTGCHFAETFEDGESTGVFQSLHAGASTPGAQTEEPFRHIRPDANLDDPAHLSRFITGTNASCHPGKEFVAPLGALPTCTSPSCCPIGDPVFGYTQRQVHYNEVARRGAFLEDVVVHGCGALKAHAQSPVVASAH